MEDPDFNSPISSGGAKEEFSAESIMMLTSMGFTEDQSKKALKATNNNVEASVEWLFSRAGDFDASADAPEGSDGSDDVKGKVNEGSSKYELIGFVSHQGPNSACGHYVRSFNFWHSRFMENNACSLAGVPYSKRRKVGHI